MAEPRLGPEELDRLEDALEGLEALQDLYDPSQAVSSRLADFQLILQATREALPLEEVRPGLLDDVFSEARLSTGGIQAPAAEPPRPESFWARMRRAWLVPVLAVAGSAALVLILVNPMLGDSPRVEESGAVAAQDAAKPRAPAEGQQAPAPAAPALAPADADDEAPGSAAPAGETTSEPPPPPAAAATSTRRGAQSSGTIVEPAPEPDPALKEDLAKVEDPKAKPKSETASAQGWNAIEQGDTARDGGDCFSARNHYARALDDGNDSVRARAYVGMGLCKRAEGNTAAADEYFDKARELDEDAVKFADTRANDEPTKPSSKKPRKKASRKRKSSMDFDEAMDPLDGL